MSLVIEKMIKVAFAVFPRFEFDLAAASDGSRMLVNARVIHPIGRHRPLYALRILCTAKVHHSNGREDLGEVVELMRQNFSEISGCS